MMKHGYFGTILLLAVVVGVVCRGSDEVTICGPGVALDGWVRPGEVTPSTTPACS